MKIEYDYQKTREKIAIFLGKSNITEEQKDVMYNVYDVVQNFENGRWFLWGLENAIKCFTFQRISKKEFQILSKSA